MIGTVLYWAHKLRRLIVVVAPLILSACAAGVLTILTHH